MSLRDLAAKTGGRVKHYTIARIEQGETGEIEPITIILGALGFDLPDIFKGEEEVPA